MMKRLIRLWQRWCAARSFRSRLLISFLSFSILPVLVLTFYSYGRIANVAQENIDKLIDNNMKMVSRNLDVTLSAAERRSIDRHLPQVSLQMAARDRRWSGGAPAIYADPAARQPVLARSARRCVFAYPTPDGLRCGLHTTAEAEELPVARLKPLPCRLFPLVLLKVRGRTVLTASVGAVGAALSAPPEHRLACLRSDLPPLHVSCRDGIEEQFGGAFYRRLAARARRREATGGLPGQNGPVDIQER